MDEAHAQDILAHLRHITGQLAHITDGLDEAIDRLGAVAGWMDIMQQRMAALEARRSSDAPPG